MGEEKTLQELARELEEARQAIVTAATDEVRLCKGQPDAFPEELTKAVELHEELSKALGLKALELMRSPGQVVPGSTQETFYLHPQEDPMPTNPPLPKKPEPPDLGAMCNGLNCRRTDGLEQCSNCGLSFCPQHSDPALHPCGDIHPSSY
jgi:hypothetical protein